MYDWYTTTLALAPSDVVYNKEGVPVTCFFHIDRGLDHTDHHAFFFKKSKPNEESTVAHAAFMILIPSSWAITISLPRGIRSVGVLDG